MDVWSDFKNNWDNWDWDSRITLVEVKPIEDNILEAYYGQISDSWQFLQLKNGYPLHLYILYN